MRRAVGEHIRPMPSLVRGGGEIINSHGGKVEIPSSARQGRAFVSTANGYGGIVTERAAEALGQQIGRNSTLSVAEGPKGYYLDAIGGSADARVHNVVTIWTDPQSSAEFHGRSAARVVKGLHKGSYIEQDAAEVEEGYQLFEGMGVLLNADRTGLEIDKNKVSRIEVYTVFDLRQFESPRGPSAPMPRRETTTISTNVL